MNVTFAALGLLCLMSLGLILVIPWFTPVKLLMRFLPRDVGEAAKDHPDPPRGMQIVGYVLLGLAAAVYVGLVVWVGADGLRRGLGFGGLFARYLILLYGYKLFDILVQDQYIVITRRYYVRFYPETKDCRGWRDRHFNTKNQLVRLAVFPFACALTAGLTLLIGGIL